MKSHGSQTCSLVLLTAALVGLAGAPPLSSLDLPWQDAGLTEPEAAAHLLNRLTFGPRPGEVERVAEMGLEEWLSQQLEARDPDRLLQSRLADLSSLNLDVLEYPEIYPNPGIVLREASEAGVLADGVDIREIDDPRAKDVTSP